MPEPEYIANRARRHGALALLLAALLLPGLACTAAEEAPGEAAPAAEEAAPEEAPPTRLEGDRTVAERIDDLSTAARVQKALVEESTLRRFDVEPTVVGGRVVLRGEVATAAQRERAAEVARGIAGVRDVVNEVVATEAPQAAPEPAPPIAEAEPPAPTESAEEEPRPEPEPEPEPEPKPAETYHTVRSGESLWTISRQYGVSIAEIRRLNNLSSDNLRPGQRLRVK